MGLYAPCLTLSNNTNACKESKSIIQTKAFKSKRTRCQSENVAMLSGNDTFERMEPLGFALEHDTTQIFAPTLPPAPYPVEPYHFYCTQMATECTVQQLSDTLRDCDFEFSLQPNRSKFKCVKYVQFHPIEFVIRIYTCANAILVEFQRRGGCLLLWDHLYQTIYTKLLPYVDRTVPACSQSSKGQKKIMSQDSFSAVLHKTLFDVKFEHSNKSSGTQVLETMVMSTMRDIQREGCKAIASITQEKENASIVFSRKNMMKALLACASSSDVEMASGAMASLRNIIDAMMDTKEGKEVRNLAERVIETSRSHLKITDSNQLHQQCDITLSLLTAKLGDKIKKPQDFI
uniref:Uncharacterized protein AlNc14C19G1983 n=1 Tax=Albugo laibachii Nc14 TaxID=890382 RepID=F0W512_9STRA|nr:conserved hypothetical protein [Albugo laibachii Nc14]|eukprot:CCA16203.1 conserved hypothetical protein [Albugo laibachii Nc14]